MPRMKYLFTALAILVCLSEGFGQTLPNINRPIVRVGGNISENRTFFRDTVYLIVGFTTIPANVTLTIQPGTILLSDFESKGTLITERGRDGSPAAPGAARRSGRIIANGTATDPIIFTSTRPNGQKRRGDGGGIVLNGLAPNNGPGGILVGEGNTGIHGGNTPMDTSGIFRYVRIEFGGTKITPDNEVNGWTFNSTGAGTVCEYLQAHFIADDGFEWFGGTVNGRYLVATGVDDDMFDMDNSYCGRLQFLVGVEDRALANRGYEIDNDATGSTARSTLGVLTCPTVYNVTLIGAGVARAGDDNNDGIYVRRNAQGLFWNHIVVNFGGFGFVVDGSASRGQFDRDSLFVRNSIMLNRGLLPLGTGTAKVNSLVAWGAFRAGTPAVYDTAGFYGRANAWGVRTVNPQLVGLTSAILNGTANPISGQPLNLRPQAGSPALTGGARPRNFSRFPGDNANFFDTTATFIGAFNQTTNWMSGWTVWATNATTFNLVSRVVEERALESRPTRFELSQNYPNPFNPTTNIRFSLPSSEVVTLKIYDITGREVATLINGERRAAGVYQLTYDASALASGVYLYRLQAGSFVDTKKMTLIK
ncbi:MAG: T9SS type A sorting domain-containing protein [Chloroherpetonaceae bacterium]|nr:T9SS type A sorting domain-containing protein [Chloroherpetonaceae bacterium]